MSDGTPTLPATSTPYLVINSTLPQTRFDICWLESVNGGQAWSKLIGCVLAIYCWSFSSKKSLWNVLLIHSIAGMVGTLMEDGWVAAANCGYQQPGAYSRFTWILFANEVNWILHESMTVYYSYIKTKVVIRNPKVDSVIQRILVLLLMGFMAARLNIGRLRYAANRLMDSNIELAHNYAFLIWGSADLILMVLLALNVLEYASQKSNPALQQGQFVLRTLLNSSIPRFAVIFINTLLICVVNFVVHYSNHDAIDYLTLQNVSKFAWMVKGSYTTLLLLDILMTRFLLYATPSGPAESEPRQSVSVNGVPMEAMDGCAPYGMQQQQQSARGVGGVGGGPDDGKLGGVPRRPTVILMPPLPALSPGATATENPYEPPRDPIPHYNSISSLLPRLGASSPRLASAPISATPPILASSSPGPLSPVASIHPIDSPRPAARGRNAAMAGGLERQLAFYPYREGVDTDEQDADSDGWWIAATTASEGSVTEIGSQGFIGYRPAVGVGRGDGL